MKKVAFHTLGCKVNAYETQSMQQQFISDGYEIVDFEDIADVYIINTCSVTNIADRKSRQMLHRARQLNPTAIVIAAGCYVNAAKDKLVQDEMIDILIGNDEKSHIIDVLNDYHAKKDGDDGSGHIVHTDVTDINQTRIFDESPACDMHDYTRGFIKIEDGCNAFCSYCLIPYVRGRVRSRQTDSILKECESLAGRGFREVVLTGIQLSGFGSDLGAPSDIAIPRLVDELSHIDGIERIRLGSLEPNIVTDNWVRAIASSGIVMPHFHLSLQSGSDTVLERMNRRYTSSEYEAAVDILREHFENPAITTDIIVGFPGESEDEFLETVDFVERISFFETHIFPYSMRSGTRAARMDGQIEKRVKERRASILGELHKRKSLAYRTLHIGGKVSVLAEKRIEIDGKSYIDGHTKEYIHVAIPYDENIQNKIIEGVLGEVIDGEIMGMEKVERVY